MSYKQYTDIYVLCQDIFVPLVYFVSGGDKMTVGERIEALIEDNDVTITELANYLGVSTKQVTRWKQETSEMGIFKLRSMCLYFNISADYILGLPRDLAWPR